MNLGNLSVRYALDKLALYRFNRRYPDAPWLTPQMVEILESWLRPTDLGLEWGAGRSSVWFARHMQHLISVESDPEWYARVKEMLASQGLTNVDLHHRTEDAEYIGIADGVAAESLDFVLVDGMLARDQCALHAIPLLKHGAILVIDNINWYLPNNSHAPGSRRAGDSSRPDAAGWDDYSNRVSTWRRILTTNGVTDTALWVKP